MEAVNHLVAIVLSIIIFTSVSALFRPLPRLGLPTRKRAGVVVVVSFMVAVIFSNLSSKPTQGERRELTAEEKCRFDNLCWGEKHRWAASVHCSDHIERLAQYDFEWTTGWGEDIFSTWVSLEGDKLLQLNFGKGVVYVGDKIKFKNVFGTFQIHTYECQFDPDSNTVLEVNAKPGRLSQRY